MINMVDNVVLDNERFYILQYNGSKRLVVLLEDRYSYTRGDGFLVWDFRARGYRQMYIDGMSDIRDVTSKCIATKNLDRIFPANISTITHNGTVFAVNLGN